MAMYYLSYFAHELLDLPSYTRLITVPLRSLNQHDIMGGHTISRHIKKKKEYLKHRLAQEPRANKMSTFWDSRIAKACINYVINEQLEHILTWLASHTSRKRLTLQTLVPVYTSVGIALNKGSNKIELLKGIKIVLEKIAPDNFFILTAFPV